MSNNKKFYKKLKKEGTLMRFDTFEHDGNRQFVHNLYKEFASKVLKQLCLDIAIREELSNDEYLSLINSAYIDWHIDLWICHNNIIFDWKTGDILV